MAGSSDAGRSQIDLARIGLGISDKVGDRLGWNRWIRHHDGGHASDASDRRDIADEIEIEFVVKRRVDRVRRAHQEKGVAARWGTHDRLGADVGAATRAVSTTNCWPSRPESHGPIG